MKKREILFELIRSLTQNEKRFFKIYASRHRVKGLNNYVKLFEAIDGLSAYDEQKLRRKIKNESFRTHLSAEKHYLYNLILECLNIYHKDSSVDRRISDYINMAKILSEKKLDEQSIRISEKAKALSYKFNRFENSMTLSALIKNVKLNADILTEKELGDCYREIFTAIGKLKAKIEYNQVFDELLLQKRQTGAVKSKEELDRLNELYSGICLRDPSGIDSFDARVYLLLAQIEYTALTRDQEKQRVYCSQLMRLLEQDPEHLADKISSYLYAMRVFIGWRLYENKEEAYAALEKISAIPSLVSKKGITREMRTRLFENYYICMTDMALRFRDYNLPISHMEKIEAGLSRMEIDLPPSASMIIKFNLACIYFGAGQFRQSLKWCNEVINDFPEYREDILCDARILSLLIHFELGNQLILPNLMKSTYRYLSKSKRLYRFESIFLKYLGFFLRAENRAEQTSLFIQFREELIPLLHDKMENIIFNDIDLIGWINKKIKKE